MLSRLGYEPDSAALAFCGDTSATNAQDGTCPAVTTKKINKQMKDPKYQHGSSEEGWMERNAPLTFDPAQPWEDQLVILSLQRCIEDRKYWIAKYEKDIKDGRDKSFDLEDERELLIALTQVLHYYKGQ